MHGRYAWCLQELWKGRHGEWLGGSAYGGWGFTANHVYYTATTDENQNESWTLWDASTANQQETSMDLKKVPFFDSDKPVPALLKAPNNPNGAGSQFAKTNRARLLAEMIPALTFATGANSLSVLNDPNGGNRNVDMNGMMNGWPAERHDPQLGDRWFHGDYHTVAYLYTYKVFDKIVRDLGALNQ